MNMAFIFRPGLLDVYILNDSINSPNEIASSSEPLSVTQLCMQIAKALQSIPDNHLAVRLDGISCGKKESISLGVGKNIKSDSLKVWMISQVKVKKKWVPIIAITSMPSHEDLVWDGFLKKMSDIKAKAPALIIDLRGNGAGDDKMAKLMAPCLPKTKIKSGRYVLAFVKKTVCGKKLKPASFDR